MTNAIDTEMTSDSVPEKNKKRSVGKVMGKFAKAYKDKYGSSNTITVGMSDGKLIKK